MLGNSTSINSYNNPHYISNKGLKESVANANAVISDAGNDAIDKNPATTLVSGISDNPASFALKYWLPSWIGINVGTNLFNRHLTSKEYPKTIFGKITAASDFIMDKLSFISHPIKSTGNWIKKFYNNHILANSQILQSFTTPTKPVSAMVRTQAQGMRYHIATDAITAIEKYIGKDVALWKDKFHELGMRITPERWAQIKADPMKYYEFLARKLTTGAAAEKEVTLASWAKFIGGQRKVNFREIGNKMQVMMGLNNPNGKSALGKLLSKVSLSSLEAMTNGTMGPRAYIALNALFLAQSIKAAMNAPKGEKLKTFAEEMTQLCSWLVTIPLAIKSYHTLAGMKYIGMHNVVKDAAGNAVVDKSLINLFRQKIKELNSLNATGALSKADYKTRLDEIKALYKGSSKWYQKPLKWIGNLMSTGLETINPCKNGNMLDKILYPFRATKAFFKRHAIGKVGRIIAIAMVLMPLFSNVCVKICHKIFGKPTKSVLDDNKSETPATTPNTVNNVPQTNNGSITDILNQNTQKPEVKVKRPDSSIIKIMENNLDNSNPLANTSIKDDKSRNYIPKDTPPLYAKKTEIDETQMQEIEKVLSHADKVIEEAMKIGD